MIRSALLRTWLILSCVALTCGAELSAQDDRADVPGLERLEVESLPNAWRLHANVISGGQPDGEAGFRALQELGVRTVISVDGARPDVETAERFGLRYVHLPHGYDGIPPERIAELAKAVRDLPGPVYIHCHHGKHRSPAAAAAACVAAGYIAPEHVEEVLTSVGTSRSYRGLYDSALKAQRIDDQQLDRLKPEFPAVVDLPPLAEAMVSIEHIRDRLLKLEAAGWRPLPKEPDLEPKHEALLLREQFTELLRTDAVRDHGKRFEQLLRDSETLALELEEALQSDDRARASELLQSIGRSCTDCHRTFRDVPLSEKARARSARPCAE